MRIKTEAGQQWAVGREMNRRIKKRFDREGIEIPFPHRTLFLGDGSRTPKLSLDNTAREEIRQVIHEELASSSTCHSVLGGESSPYDASQEPLENRGGSA